MNDRTAGCVDGYYRNGTSGTCIKCLPGYIGPNCSVPCLEGLYGNECQQQCPSSCSICNIIDGSCPKDMINTTSHLIQRRSRSAFYIVTTFGCVTVLALLLVLMFYIYKLATQPLPQNFTFTVQDPESEAGRNIVNPACGSIYENI
ncbi:platelet endothelial aggregation receptor 1-like [Ostrea edulis]|uniref:platelet endothelial aggregation receptor 1-like n=1 Tax=Ostrea edulis TaxID=37623 RepID=UPI0024AF505D|nr:platelet endothelial aggregation receptor 1-like [Ostrea edulis]